MEPITLHNDIYIDPLTGLFNFFKFIENDFSRISKEKGSIIIFDMADFTSINENLGRVVGDIYLKNLADSIRFSISEINSALPFRTNGDEFTLILPNVKYEHALILASIIESKYKELTIDKGYTKVKIHVLVLGYEKTIKSIEEFYELLIRECNTKSDNKYKFSKDNLFKSIIGGIINRVKDTLEYYNSAYNLALTDDISGLQNGRAVRLYLENLIDICKNKSEGFTILFIDGDNLKRYNKISYCRGNEMIKDLSNIIINSVRKEDKVYRWLSGDEFLVILKESDSENSVKIAENIRENVENQTINWVYPITVSIGMASYPKDSYKIDEVIDKAEKANNKAKILGKNKVVRWVDLII